MVIFAYLETAANFVEWAEDQWKCFQKHHPKIAMKEKRKTYKLAETSTSFFLGFPGSCPVALSCQGKVKICVCPQLRATEQP